MFGSVAVIRESGINSLRLATSITLAICRGSNAYGMPCKPSDSAGGAGGNQRRAAGLVLWRLLRIISRRRLNPDNEY